ncbi:ferric reductase-like transmembrane domain-containing protein [Candidatus Saccharibacteria bacterium]|nr:ferric reductase-like transmembrane domain-containing protein [Candidatus Saccharibacteria bacterium]
MLKKMIVLCLLLFGFTLFPLSHPVLAADAGNVVVQTIPDENTLGDKLVSRAGSSWPWYVARASGLVAALALVILMISGIGQISGMTFRLLDPLTAWASHRALGITFGIAVLVHMISLLFDHFVQFNIWQILIPWLSDYQPVTLLGFQLGSLYVALGVLAFYLTLVIIVTSLIWVERKPHTWKLIHLLSYLTIAFVFVHALYLGTDLTHGVYRLLWIMFNVGILGLAITRSWRAFTT